MRGQPTGRVRKLVTGLCVAVVSLVLSLTLAEILLRAEIDRLPTVWANELGNGYGIFGNGIYRFDPALNMPRMRPHYDRKMFANGYHWLHHGDWMGFRNPVDRKQVDIALIGDSMIYGQAANESATVRSHLEALLGRPVANLGVQGGAIDWEYEILRHDAVRLHPRYVFIFFFNNDITDLLDRLNDDEMHRFLQLPVSDHTTRYFNLKPASWRGQSDYSMQDLYVDRSYRLLKHLINAWLAEHFKHRHRVPAAAPVSAANAPSPIRVTKDGAGSAAAQPAPPTWITQPPFAGDPQMQLALQFHLRALLKAKDFADRHGMRMAYVFIAVPLPYDSLYEKINADYCSANGIDFFSLRPAFDAARSAGVTINLPNDGHLTDAAAAVTARALADHFRLRDASAWR